MEKPYVVGMDIGGTNTVFGIVDSRGTVLASDSIKTHQFEKVEDYVDCRMRADASVIGTIRRSRQNQRDGCRCAPTAIIIVALSNLRLTCHGKGIIPLAAMFEERLGILLP